MGTRSAGVVRNSTSLPRTAADQCCREHMHTHAVRSAQAVSLWVPRQRTGAMGGDTTKRAWRTALLVPNLIGYARFAMIAVAFGALRDSHAAFLALYCLQAFLDVVDGWAARVLDQKSALGAWLDVLVDNIGRTLLWVVTPYPVLGASLACIEWTAFVCLHTGGPEWKDAPLCAPWVVTRVMANGFKTPMGAFAIAGLHVLPIWLYVLGTGDLVAGGAFGSPLCALVTVVLGSGRALCAVVELWFIHFHAHHLAAQG